LNIFDNPTPMRRHVAKKKVEILRLTSLLTPRALETTNFFYPVINAPEKEKDHEYWSQDVLYKTNDKAALQKKATSTSKVESMNMLNT
jgi:hypothetical protein